MADSISLLPERIQWWYELQDAKDICQKVREVAKSKLQIADAYTNEAPFSESVGAFGDRYFNCSEAGDMQESDRYFRIARLYSSLVCCEEGDVRGAIYELYFGLGESVENFFDAMVAAQ